MPVPHARMATSALLLEIMLLAVVVIETGRRIGGATARAAWLQIIASFCMLHPLQAHLLLIERCAHTTDARWCCW